MLNIFCISCHLCRLSLFSFLDLKMLNLPNVCEMLKAKIRLFLLRYNGIDLALIKRYHSFYFFLWLYRRRQRFSLYDLFKLCLYVCPPVCWSFWLSILLSIGPSVFLSLCLSVYLYVCLSFCWYVYSSDCQAVLLSVFQSFT